jgi:hypothetical protein
MSFAVTSSQRQAKHLPLRSLITGGGTATCGGQAPGRSRFSRSFSARAREFASPRPSECAASLPATAPDSSAASSSEWPVSWPATCTSSGTWASVK